MVSDGTPPALARRMTRFARHVAAALFLLLLCGGCLNNNGCGDVGRCGWRSCRSSFGYVVEADGGVPDDLFADDAGIPSFEFTDDAGVPSP